MLISGPYSTLPPLCPTACNIIHEWAVLPPFVKSEHSVKDDDHHIHILPSTLNSGKIIRRGSKPIIAEKLQDMSSSYSVSQGSGPGYRRFTLAEIKKATSNFDDSELVGESKKSRTYKGVIVDEQGGSRSTVAVKRFNELRHGKFSNEVLVFSKYRSKYLISLLGICDEYGVSIIVYEYMSNGNLANHLNRLRSSLSWEQRLKICIDVARGMEFLHHVKLDKRRLVHGQLDPSKILLDQNMAAKLSGFANTDLGSKVIMRDSLELYDKKTNPYVDPYYYLTGNLSQRSDVYAFGMILLEVLCKRLPKRHLYHGKYNKEGETLRQWVKGNFDTCLREQISPDCFDKFVDIVEACTMEDPKCRPDMSQLVLKLEYVLLQSQRQNGDTVRVPVEGPLFTFDLAVITTQENDEPQRDSRHSKKEEQKDKPKRSKSVRFEEPVQKVKLLVESASSTFDPTEVENKDSDDANHSAQEQEPDISSSPQRLFRQFSLAEIIVATEDFDPKMVCGKGGEAKVYQGILVNDDTENYVAVKRLKPKAVDPTKEIEMLSMMHHPNLVSLLGSCQESGEKILVYEYMPNGSLDNYLLRTTSGRLSWEQRLKICIGAASGLEYLHTCPTKSGQGHIHRDVKPLNILLDENWVAKIADFGLAKKRLSNQILSEIATRVRGTPGYYAPEYLYSGKVSRSVDVYAFGIVLFEVLCRKRPWASHHADCDDIDDSDEGIEGDDIRLWARENIDKNLEEPISENCLEVFIDVAAKCYDDKKERPIMSEVVSKLKYVLELHKSGN